MRAAVLVPIKGFGRAKGRLAEHLDHTERAELARRLAATVLSAADPLAVWVVCDDDEVELFADGHGARVVRHASQGLNDAVQHAVEVMAADGIDRVVVAHGDLPYARQLAWVADFDGVTLVPDRHDDGTNVICIPTGSGFTFAYGPGSFSRHLDHAAMIGLATRVVRDSALGLDIDTPADLATVDTWTIPDSPRS